MEDQIDVVMPKLGLTMTEGVLVEWRVATGQAVQAGDILFVVETDKITNEIEADRDGVLVELLAAEGDTVEVGLPVARWASGATAPVVTLQARRRAAEEGVDIAAVRPTPGAGLVLAADVDHAVSAFGHAALGGAESPVLRRPSRAARLVAERMVTSKSTIPHFYVETEAHIAAAQALRKQEGATLNDLLVAAVGRALLGEAGLRDLWRTGGIQEDGASDVGVVVGTERGPVAPVLRAAGRLSLADVSSAMADLAARARSGRLSPDELGGGVVSVSNVGMFGATRLVPVINPGQSAILGVGAAQQVVTAGGGGFHVTERITLTLSADHRVIDGIAGAKFLAAVKALLETPTALLAAP